MFATKRIVGKNDNCDEKFLCSTKIYFGNSDWSLLMMETNVSLFLLHIYSTENTHKVHNPREFEMALFVIPKLLFILPSPILFALVRKIYFHIQLNSLFILQNILLQ